MRKSLRRLAGLLLAASALWASSSVVTPASATEGNWPVSRPGVHASLLIDTEGNWPV